MSNVIKNTPELVDAMKRISFAPSCIDFSWDFEYEPVGKAGDKYMGWFVWANFKRPDTATGKMGIGIGRKEFIPVGAFEDSVIKTCWLLVELIVRHELMEAFLVDGKRIFDPHASLEALMHGKTAHPKARRIGGEFMAEIEPYV